MKSRTIWAARFPLYGAAIRIHFDKKPTSEQVYAAYYGVWEDAAIEKKTKFLEDAKNNIDKHLQISEEVLYQLETQP